MELTLVVIHQRQAVYQGSGSAAKVRDVLGWQQLSLLSIGSEEVSQPALGFQTNVAVEILWLSDAAVCAASHRQPLAVHVQLGSSPHDGCLFC